MVIYPFYKIYEFLFPPLFIYHWTCYCMDEFLFIYIIHVMLVLQCGPSTYESIFSSSMFRISSCSTFSPSFKLYKYNLSYKWHCFYQLYLSKDLVAGFCCPKVGQFALVFRQDVSNVYSSKNWIVLVDYIFTHEFWLFSRACIFLFVSWMNTL